MTSPDERKVDQFPIGSRVRKVKGYKFEGHVLGTFTKRDGRTVFVNVEHDDGWVMHFSENDLDLAGQGKVEAGDDVDYKALLERLPAACEEASKLLDEDLADITPPATKAAAEARKGTGVEELSAFYKGWDAGCAATKIQCGDVMATTHNAVPPSKEDAEARWLSHEPLITAGLVVVEGE